MEISWSIIDYKWLRNALAFFFITSGLLPVGCQCSYLLWPWFLSWGCTQVWWDSPLRVLLALSSLQSLAVWTSCLLTSWTAGSHHIGPSNEGCQSLWWQLLQCHKECFDSSISLQHGWEIIVVVTGIRSRSTGSGSRSQGLWQDQGGSHVPATWCAGRMGHWLIWVISMGVKSSKTGH